MDENQKYEALKEYLRSAGSVAVAFSSGVDSTFLLYAAKEALGADHVLAVTACSAMFPQRERSEADQFCRNLGIRQIEMKHDVNRIEGFADNPPDRCYLCKRNLFLGIRQLADENGMKEVVEGSNLDDMGDYRPGLKAISELKIKSPLRAVGFTKAEIRSLSKELGLPTWDKPSYACLASRFVYGERITEEKLAMVEKAEQLFLERGFRQIRVRMHGNLARIEMDPADFSRFLQDEVRVPVYEEMKKIGFSYVSLDLVGYRTGSMNETLPSGKTL